MKTKVFILVACCVVLSGCAGTIRHNAEMRAEFERTIPVCDNEVQCKERWSAAQVWVAKNCGMKVQVVTDTLIETHSGFESNSTALAASVIKEPLGNGKYRIIIAAGCRNPFGCYPVNPIEAALDFNRYVGSL